ncbi:MAG: sulfatase-like hydrolase/transferase, partial [Anaplasmataceae bacterium]|nr:sulfatase-like hydrolase/transferase [Anaplasmataceae bacterium]
YYSELDLNKQANKYPQQYFRALKLCWIYIRLYWCANKCKSAVHSDKDFEVSMRLFSRCLVLFFCVWIGWLLFLILPGSSLGVETINKDFLRIMHNFTAWPLITDTLLFLISQWLLLIFISWFAFLTARGLQLIFKFSEWVAASTSVAIIITSLHFLNSILYPISTTAFAINESWAYPLLAILCFFLLAFALLACLRQHRLIAPTLSLFILVLVPAYWSELVNTPTAQANATQTQNTPNILIIGVDALRPSELTYFGGEHNVMPFLDQLLQRSEVFTQNYTPAARTHAAWVALLSGRYPYHNGARFNLTEDHLIDKKKLITHTLKQHGYRTVWGLDERRFNNISESYGFDVAVGPKVGAADFLITKFSDNPIVNLLSNTQIGAILFPYIYLNRGNFVTYIPYQFNEDLVNAMRGEKPVFLSAHLTLPHYPFINHLMKPIVLDEKASIYYRNYLSMLELSDRQLINLFDKLSKQGFLENTLVYLISDHGEGFPDVDKGLGKGNAYSDFKVDSYGHGTNVLTLSQYHTLMARIKFQNGEIVSRPRRSEKLTALVDIAPDIINQLGIGNSYNFDGYSLDSLADRTVILESSFSNDAVSSSRINQLQVLQQSAEAYYVAKDGRLLLQGDLYNGFNQAKQRALIGSDGVMVAIFPDEKEHAFVVDIAQNTWWPSIPYVPLDNRWHRHLQELCQFYKDDISFDQKNLCNIENK